MQNTYKKDYDDRFTRLPNLQQFRILSRQIIGSQAMRSQGMAFVYLNLKSPRSRAEEANDDDLLLETVVQAVQATFQGRIVARLSKYHLAVVTTNICLPERLEEMYEDIRALRHNIPIELKAGIYILDPSDDDPELALDHASAACRSINDRTDTHIVYYDSRLDMAGRMQSYVRSHLLSAIGQKQIVPCYQPLADHATGKICCYEVKAGWKDPALGWLYPEEFRDVLEEYRLIKKLDLFLVRQVCENFNILKARGLPLLPAIVKISESDFGLMDVVEEIDAILRGMNVPRDYLYIEITESALSGEHRELVGKGTDEFRNLGYQVWLDDFGSGYASLLNLQKHRFDALKVDRVFLENLQVKSRSYEVLSAIAAMAEELHLKTVIQGVETEGIHNLLKNLGHDMEQGSFLGIPVPLEKLKLH